MRTLRKSERPLGIGSLTTRTVVQETYHRGNDGPSHVSVCGHLEKIGQWGVRAVETDPMTVRRGYEGLSSKSRSVTQ